MSQRPRLCIFCGSNANSKEHIWPTWLHHLLPPVSDKVRHNKEVHNFTPKTGIRISGAMGRQGDQRTVKVRAVCDICNNGWMNRIEQQARPILTPLITGKPMTLEPPAIVVLARWFALKVIVAEHDAPNMTLTPLVDRELFRKTGELPPYFRLYAAHNIGEESLFFMRHSHCMAFSRQTPHPALDGTTKNVQTVTMVIGILVLQAVCTRISDVSFEDKAMVIGFHNRCRFWPRPDNAINFPSRPYLDDEGIFQVANLMERYIEKSNPLWVE